MKNRLILSLFLFLAAASCKKETVDPEGGGNTGGTGGTGGTGSGSVVYNLNKDLMLQLVNEARQKGCTCGTTVMPAVPAVTWNDLLAKAAYDHSKDMYTNNYFSHTGKNGSSAGDRIKAAGYNWLSYGENIANGYTSEQSVMNAWLASEGHCKNIMSASVKEMGAGREGNYWTQVFGKK
jgi:uncharacterized protein YkwD